MSKRVPFVVLDQDGITKGGRHYRQADIFQAVPGGAHVRRWIRQGRVKALAFTKATDPSFRPPGRPRRSKLNPPPTQFGKGRTSLEGGGSQ